MGGFFAVGFSLAIFRAAKGIFLVHCVDKQYPQKGVL